MGLLHSSPLKIHTETKCSKNQLKAKTSQEESIKEQWLAQRELYSLLPLGIGTPKMEEQERGN
jgi:hypothetical protein